MLPDPSPPVAGGFTGADRLAAAEQVAAEELAAEQVAAEELAAETVTAEATEPGAPAPVDVRSAASRGAITSLSSRWARTVLQLLSSVVLARLLSPSDFGLVALMTVVTGLAALFQDLGLATAVVRARSVTRAQQSTIFWCNLALGVVLSLALFFCSPLLASVYNAPELTAVGRALSPTFTIAALTGQARATLQRNLRFSVISFSEVVIGVAYLVAAVVCALLGFGYWSLVAASLLSSVVWAVTLLSASRFKAVRPAPLREVRTLLLQGVQITGIQATTYLSRTLDVVVVGRFFGPANVGLYNRASQVVSLAEAQLTAAITSVTLPVLSRLQDETDRFNGFLARAVSAIGYTLVPMFFGLSLAAEPLVTLVYGPQWGVAGRLLVVLALAGTVRSLLLLVEQAATAVGIMGRQFTMTVTTQLLTVGALVVVARHGLEPVAITYVAATGVSVVVGSVWVARGSMIDLGSVARTFARPMALWTLAYVAGRAVEAYTGLHTAWPTALAGVATMLVVGLGIAALFRATRRDIASVLQIVTSARRRRA